MKKIGKHGESFFLMFGNGLCVITGTFLRSECVYGGAYAVGFVGNVERRAGFGSLEVNVFDKVRNTVYIFAFVTAARRNYYAGRYGERSVHLLYDKFKSAVVFFIKFHLYFYYP